MIEKLFDKHKEFLDKEEFEQFKFFCQKPLRKSIRVNNLKISLEEFKKIAKKNEWQLSQIEWEKNGFFIDRENRQNPLGKHFLHLFGYFYIQEASSMIPPSILEPKKNEIILDMCSSPGSKTTQISSMIENTGLVVANEFNPSRLKVLDFNLKKSGIFNQIITNKDGRAFSQYFPNFFDKVLIDSPCSGDGTIRKNKEFLTYWNEKSIKVISKTQKMLIEEGFHSLKVGGEMIYSTCSMSKEENEDIVNFLLEKYPNNIEMIEIKRDFIKKEKNPYGIQGVFRVLPQDFDTEGFFIAKFRKTNESRSIFYKGIKPWNRKSPFSKISKSMFNLLKKEISKFGVEDFLFLEKLEKNLFQRGKEIFLRSNLAEILLEKISGNAGMKVGDIFGNEIDFTYEGIMFFSKYFKKNIIEISEDDYKKIILGEDLYSQNLANGSYIGAFEGINIAFFKSVNGVLKNKIPASLIFNV